MKSSLACPCEAFGCETLKAGTTIHLELREKNGLAVRIYEGYPAAKPFSSRSIYLDNCRACLQCS